MGQRKQQRYSGEWRQRVRDGVNRRHREIQEEGHPLPDKKRCPRCKSVKDASEYGKRRHTLKSGLVSETLESWCNPCKAAAQRERIERLAREGVDLRKLRREAAREWRASLSEVKRRKLRKRMREAQTAQRRKNGSRPYKPRKTLHLKDKEVPAEPIAKWLREEMIVNRKKSISEDAIAAQTGVPSRRIGALLREEQAAVRLSTVDRILIGLDAPHVLHELYPQDE